MPAQHFKMIADAYNFDKIQTWDKKCLTVLPTTLPCYSSVASSYFRSVYFPSDVGHDTQERSFLAPRNMDAKLGKPDSGSVVLSEKDLDQRRWRVGEGSCENR